MTLQKSFISLVESQKDEDNLVLTQDRKISWNYARFLNHCVKRRLLQRIGGRYRFIHRELLRSLCPLQKPLLTESCVVAQLL